MTASSKNMQLTAALVACCHRVVDDPGPGSEQDDYFTDADYHNIVDSVLAAAPAGGFWLFAYGSLIWKPEVPVVEKRLAIAQGWHRAFSMKIEHYRATPDQPGYMMCLDRGGNCKGVALRLPEENLPHHLYKLLYREIGSHEALEAARWINVATDAGPLRALTFYAAPVRLPSYKPGRPLSEIAYALARACGHWGSGAEYLRNTVAHLQELGIEDDNLWQLQELVAEEIVRLHGVSQNKESTKSSESPPVL